MTETKKAVSPDAGDWQDYLQLIAVDPRYKCLA